MKIKEKVKKKRNLMRLIVRLGDDPTLFLNVMDTRVLVAALYLGIITKSVYYGLTHYQTTNFRLFQTKKVCRRQNQI